MKRPPSEASLGRESLGEGRLGETSEPMDKNRRAPERSGEGLPAQRCISGTTASAHWEMIRIDSRAAMTANFHDLRHHAFCQAHHQSLGPGRTAAELPCDHSASQLVQAGVLPLPRLARAARQASFSARNLFEACSLLLLKSSRVLSEAKLSAMKSTPSWPSTPAS